MRYGKQYPSGELMKYCFFFVDNCEKPWYFVYDICRSTRRFFMKKVFIVPAVLSGLIIFMSGCMHLPEADSVPVDGGTTDNSDPDAPKQITSTDISAFDASFTLHTRWTADTEDSTYHFEIKPAGNGNLTVFEEMHDLSHPADSEILHKVQGVIEKYDLVSMNGVNQTTAGLPPEYQPGGLTVHYTSGESLYFRTDNNPLAEWAEEMYDVFAAWFSANGNDGLYPPEETEPVTRFSLHYIIDGMEYEYRSREEGDVRRISESIYDLNEQKEISDRTADMPEDYFDGIAEIVSRYHIDRTYDFSIFDRQANNLGNHDAGYYGMGDKTTADNEPDAENMYLDIYIQYDNKRNINIETQKESEIEGMKNIIEDFMEYHRSLF